MYVYLKCSDAYARAVYILSHITKGQSGISKILYCIFIIILIKFTIEFCQRDFRQVGCFSDGGGIRLTKFAIGMGKLR